MPVYVSDLLTATPAPVNAVPTATRTWQWLRGSTAISGATSSTYTAVTADIGATIAASQIETNVAGTATATSAPTEVIQAFDPIRLFSASEPGVWYDPNDISTLFQDAAGTIPVTGPVGPAGQAIPVGLMLDKSRGGEQSLPTTGWTVNSGDGVVTIAGNVITIANATTTTRVDITSPGWVVGDFGRVTVDTSIGTSTGATVWVGGAGPNSASAGVRTYSGFVAASTLTRVQVGTGTATFTVISRSRTPGNHATQSITASQPIYGIVPAGGRRNQIVYSEQFDNAAWVKSNATVSSTQYLAPNGTVTAELIYPSTSGNDRWVYQILSSISGVYSRSVYAKAAGKSYLKIDAIGDGLSGAYFNLSTGIKGTVSAGYTSDMQPAGDGWYRCTIYNNSNQVLSFGGVYSVTDADNSRAVTANGTDGILIWGAQFETGSTATPYQRVTTQYDVTEAGVASLGYLFFDGSGDFMSTGTITPGTDKAQVFTGVRKLTDATAACVAELGTSISANNGTFALFAPGTNGAADYYSGVRGTAIQNLQTATTYPAPITNVITILGDIPGDLSTLRANGTQAAQSTADAGAGNFLAYPLYIGRRAGSTLPLNGQLFPLIVRFGPNLTTARISATESWVASKTAGAPAL